MRSFPGLVRYSEVWSSRTDRNPDDFNFTVSLEVWVDRETDGLKSLWSLPQFPGLGLDEI